MFERLRINQRIRALRKEANDVTTREERFRQFVQDTLIGIHKTGNETQRLVRLVLQQERKQMADLDGIRADIATIKANEEAETAAIQALADRLGNNPTAEEIAAVRADLQAVIDNQGANNAAINSLDPDVPEGSVTPEG